MGGAAEPKLDLRRANDLLYLLLTRIPDFYPKWKNREKIPILDPNDPDYPERRSDILALAEDHDDVGMALLKMAARMGEVVVDQLNRAPQKHFLTFLDLMGVDRAPPKPARVPLTFALAEGAKQTGFVPKGAKIGVIEAEDTVFETEVDTSVDKLLLKRLVSIHPQTDQWTKHKLGPDGSLIDSPLVFHGDLSEQRIEHVLWLGHRYLMELSGSTKLTILFRLTGSVGPFNAFIRSLRWEASAKWHRLIPTIEINGNALEVSFESITKIEESEVVSVDTAGRQQHHSSGWLRLRSTQPVPIGLPELQSVKLEFAQTGSQQIPDLAFSNASPIDLSKDFYPFGERPRFNDTFYFACESVLSRKGAPVQINITLTAGLPEPDTDSVSLNWEYWDGKTWALLGQSIVPAQEKQPLSQEGFDDATEALKKGGVVEFICPVIEKTAINGQENYWIRVRITAGDYGKEAQLYLLDSSTTAPQQRTLCDYRYLPDSFKPPSIAEISLSSDYTETVLPEACLSSTAGRYTILTDMRPFPLVERTMETSPSLLLGLSGVEDLGAPTLSLYFQLHPPRFGNRRPMIGSEEPNADPLIVWEFWNGNSWIRLTVEDETENLARPGLIRFDRPSSMRANRLFGERLVWIRASLLRGSCVSPKLGGIFSNTVWATQGTTIENEVLGSSNGEPSQSFVFSKAPVLQGEIVEVREPTVPPGHEGVREVRDAEGRVTEIWVKWQPVARYTGSGASDRHYVIDRASGTLVFGDGVNGLIPPIGKANIRVVLYRSGGGRVGNRPAGTINVLKKTYPFVDSVTNHQPAAGGIDQEDLEQVRVRGPHTVKNRGRAVTTEDYEWLALQTFGQIARVRCLSNVKRGPSGTLVRRNGWVTLVIVPDEEGITPLPTQSLLRDVRKTIAEKCLLSLVDRLHVIGPQYLEVRVEVTLVPQPDSEEKRVQSQVNRALQDFLHPLYGGSDQTGWEFGRSVSRSEIIRVIKGTHGVDRLISISLHAGQGPALMAITLPEFGLPYSGRHMIKIERR